MKTKIRTFLFGVLFAVAVPTIGFAQDIRVQLATEEAPHYVGIPAIVQLKVQGLEANPEPTCIAKVSSDSIKANLIALNPQISRQIYQSGNQRRIVEQATYTIQFRVTADKPGDYQIGPFEIKQGSTSKTVESIEMSFEGVPETEDMRVKLKLPESAYPDQRVPVGIEWWFAGETDNLNELNISASFFDQFRFTADQPPRRGDSQIPIQTKDGKVMLAATARSETVDGKTFTVVSAKRTMIPDRPGQFDLEPITATIELVTQWQRRRGGFGGFGGSLFEDAFGGGRRPAKTQRFRAVGDPVSLVVKPFPKSDQPESFSGAVGNGFSLEVAADRTVVRVGDPIRLTVDLRGDGNIRNAKLPSLSADGGLSPDQFRLPDGDVAGVVEDGGKQFTVSVRVLDESVSELPAIAYSWFDPEKESYRTARSKPIALRVMPAQMVGADAVVSSRSTEASMDDDVAQDMETAANENTTSKTAFTLTGADLSIQTDTTKLLVGSASALSNGSLQVLGYGLGSFALLVSLWDKRRRQVDPAVREAVIRLRSQRTKIQNARAMPEKEAASEVASALQAVLAEAEGENRSSVMNVISECETIAYRPQENENAKLDTGLVDQALAAIDSLKQTVSS